jgi:hypothetical protein
MSTAAASWLPNVQSYFLQAVIPQLTAKVVNLISRKARMIPTSELEFSIPE